MLKTSTPTPNDSTSLKAPSPAHEGPQPKERTLRFLRQFARAYTAPINSGTLPGLVLN
ncbi:MAG: hypothetical protein K2I26_10520 [Paramuribaculum sp.]|nr:hypothetical protein [Paramuribaculum sp.]